MKRMKRSEIVVAGGEQLLIVEDAVDTALGETGELISKLTRLRVANSMSTAYGQDAMDAIIESALRLNEARGAMVRAHSHLSEVRAQMGCATVAVGNNYDKPINGSTFISGHETSGGVAA